MKLLDAIVSCMCRMHNGIKKEGLAFYTINLTGGTDIHNILRLQLGCIFGFAIRKKEASSGYN
jgi:hypothetical protein